MSQSPPPQSELARDWSTARRWRHAIKPGSWPKLLVPMALGQVMGVVASGQVSLAGLVLGFAFTILDGIFIVTLNDWGDARVDRIKRQMFPDGCSPKTIPDGILPAGALLRAGLLAGAGAALVGAIGELWLGRPGLFAAALGCLSIFVAYSLPPLQLNYRGGGELLEALGVGAALPLLHAYLQSGVAWAPPYELVLGFVWLSLASALASGLSDERSDARGGKTTFTTLWGNAAAREAAEWALPIGLACWLITALRHPSMVPLWGVVAAAGAVGWAMTRLLLVSPLAVTDAFGAIRLYKLHLHRAIWYGALTLSAAMAAQWLWLSAGLS